MKKITKFLLVAALYYNTQVSGQTTYNNVASIFYAHCTMCHNNGGIAPFPLLSYLDVSSWSGSISVALNNGIMPPWHADTAFVTSGHTGARFLHENVLTAAQKDSILTWINAGKPQGDSVLAPTPPRYGDMTYKLNGSADLTLTIPPFKSNASASLQNPYNCFSLPTNLVEDRWLRAYEIVPGNRSIIHHIVVSIDTAGTTATDTSGNCSAQAPVLLESWEVSAPPEIFPNSPSFKLGIRIPKGSKIFMQIHYAPGSGGILDSTKIRLFFYPKGATGIRTIHCDAMLQNWNYYVQRNGAISIPKDSVRTYMGLSTNIGIAHVPQPTTAMTILAVDPHSHKVCTKIKIYAANTSGTDTIPIVNIKDWDFNWQGTYSYPKPLIIPPGYILKSEHVFNNTISNHHLDPSVPIADVNFGQATSSEMLFDSFYWLDYQTGDENVDIKSITDNDTLLRVGINEIANVTKSSIQLFIYPNPFSSQTTISFAQEQKNTSIKIMDVLGNEIRTINFTGKQCVIEKAEMSTGIYFVQIIDSSKNVVNRKIVVQ